MGRPGTAGRRRRAILDSCEKHPHEMGVALCRRCGAWCSTCLVYSFGPKKPPYCMSCAMVAGGVRTSSALPAMPRKELKAQMRARRTSGRGQAGRRRGGHARGEAQGRAAPAVTADRLGHPLVGGPRRALGD